MTRASVDKSMAIGLIVFGLTYWGTLSIAAVLEKSAPGVEHRVDGFVLLLYFLISLVALGSHAAAAAWIRNRGRLPRFKTFLLAESCMAAVSAVVLLLGESTTLWGLLNLVLGPASITLATFGILKPGSQHPQVEGK